MLAAVRALRDELEAPQAVHADETPRKLRRPQPRLAAAGAVGRRSAPSLVSRAAAGPPGPLSVSMRSATSRGYRCLQRLRGRGVPSQEIRRAHWLLAGGLDHLQPKRPVRGAEQQFLTGRLDLTLRR